jgi:hypothetical protein
MRLLTKTTIQVVMIVAAAAIGAAGAQDVPYGVGDWPEALGNHRARICVEHPANAVWVHLPWRRLTRTPPEDCPS